MLGWGFGVRQLDLKDLKTNLSTLENSGQRS